MQFVNGFLFTEDRKKVVLILKDRPTRQAGKLNGVGGKVEVKDLNPQRAMIREFEEEVGVRLKPNQWEQFATGRTSIPHDFVHFYRAFNDEMFELAETQESEVINKLWVSQVLAGDYPLMSSLEWLIPLALADTNNTGHVTYSIIGPSFVRNPKLINSC